MPRLQCVHEPTLDDYLLAEEFDNACDGHAASMNAVYSACIDPDAATGKPFEVGTAVAVRTGSYANQVGVIASFSSTGKSAKLTITEGADKGKTTGNLNIAILSAVGSFGCVNLDNFVTGRFLVAPVKSEGGKPDCEAMVAALNNAVSTTA